MKKLVLQTERKINYSILMGDSITKVSIRKQGESCVGKFGIEKSDKTIYWENGNYEY